MISYLFFWIFEYFKSENTDIGWQKTRALIATSGIIITNILAVLYFTNSIFFKDLNLLNTILSGNHYLDRLVILPILVSPIFFFFYLMGFKRIDDKIDFYRNEPTREKRRKRNLIIIYIAISFLLVSLSVFSPLFIK